MNRRGVPLLGVLSASVGWAAHATAQAANVPAPSLWAEWQAPPECPQEAQLVAQTEAFLGHPLNASGDRKLEIVGRVRSDEAHGFVVSLHVRTSRGAQRRELAHHDCGALTEAAALVAALAIDPQLEPPEKLRHDPAPEERGRETTAAAPLEAERPAAAPPLGVAPRAVTAPPLATFDAAPHSEPEPAEVHSSLAALGLVGSSVLPGAGVGVGVQAMLGPSRFRMAAQGAYWLSRFEPVSGKDGAGIELGAWSVALKACGLPKTGALSLAVCLGPAIGDMYGAGSDALSNAVTAHEHWSALAAEVSLSIATSAGVATLVGLELAKTLESPRFGVTTDGKGREIFRANEWFLNGFIGIGVFR